MRAYPSTTHLAEKLHAYTMPRTRVNTRLKDQVDMPLIGLALEGLTSCELREAFELTFVFRNTHPLPAALPPPPPEWLAPNDRLRVEEELPWKSLADLHAASAHLIDPVLDGIIATCSAETARWVP